MNTTILKASLLLCVWGQAQAFTAPTPPVAKMIPFVDNFHDDPRVDNYRWMHDNTSPEVRSHLEAENAYANAILAKNSALTDQLYEELKALRDSSRKQIVKATKKFIYYKTKSNKESHWVWFRKDKETGRAQQVLNENEIAKGLEYFDAYDVQLSPEEGRALFTADLKGRRHMSPIIVDLRTMKYEILKPDLYWSLQGVLWLNEDEIVFSGTTDELAPYQLYKYDLAEKKTTLIKEFSDPGSRRISSYTSDGKFVVVKLDRSKSSEYYLLNATGDALTSLSPDGNYIETFDHNRHGWLKLTNRFDPAFQILIEADASADKWEVLFTPPRGMISDFKITDAAVVAKVMDEATERIYVIDIESKKVTEVPGPEKLMFYQTVMTDFYANKAYLQQASYTLPFETVSCNLSSCAPKLEVASSILGFNKGLYQTELIYVKARDGETVPVSLFYRKDKFTGKDQPVQIYGYGSYGYSSTPTFKKELIPLLDRGVIGVVAHIRGGKEKGERWYDQGRLFNKMNTFNDFIDVTTDLINRGMTSPSKIGIEGLSAGGLLMGAVLNLRPDLFSVALVKVPFVDVLNTMTLYYDPLAKYEKEEWGDGLIREQYDYIKSYDPYTNITKQKYPAVMVRTGFEDAAVYYFQPMKWVAKMRELNSPGEENPLIFLTSFGGGHYFPGMDESDRAAATEYAFVLSQMDL